MSEQSPSLPSPSTNSQDVYDYLVAHQSTEVWDYQPLVLELHRWQSIMELRFKLQIPRIALTIARLNRRRLGHFRPGHNGFGLKHEIAIAEQHVRDRCSTGDGARILETLLHELLHAWQAKNGTPGRNNYQNVEFRQKAESCGLLIDERGVSLGVIPSGPFAELLLKHGFNLPQVDHSVIAIQKAAPTKLRLWECGCPIKARIAVAEVRIRCEVCGHRFILKN